MNFRPMAPTARAPRCSFISDCFPAPHNRFGGWLELILVRRDIHIRRGLGGGWFVLFVIFCPTMRRSPLHELRCTMKQKKKRISVANGKGYYYCFGNCCGLLVGACLLQATLPSDRYFARQQRLTRFFEDDSEEPRLSELAQKGERERDRAFGVIRLGIF